MWIQPNAYLLDKRFFIRKEREQMRHLLTIAGSDSGGGAGIQADLKTFSALGTYGMSVICAVTAQNTQGVQEVFDLPAGIIASQLDSVFSDIRVDAVKIGMLSRPEIIQTVAEKLRQYRPKLVVLDPVMVSKNGCPLLQPDAVDALREQMLPLCTIATPNIPEAQVLTGLTIETQAQMEQALHKIHEFGAKHVLIKGGHLPGDAVDYLYDGSDIFPFPAKRIDTKHTHGTGCTLSSAIAALLARGNSVQDAVKGAKEYVTTAIAHAIPLGTGIGPTNHFYALYQRAGLDTENQGGIFPRK